MVISFWQNINPINLKFNSESLYQVDNHKHLGVTISNKNSNRPKTDPCGTPAFNVPSEDI
jgi:hypothetical protein